jgi:hypothetical protein
MPQRIFWQPLDGDFCYAIVWFCVPHHCPECYLLLKSPSGQRWCFKCVALGADAPNAPVQPTIAADDQARQPEPESP